MKEQPEVKLFVIIWRYHDGSASGALRVYKYRDVAERDLAMLSDHASSKIWEIVEVDYIGWQS